MKRFKVDTSLFLTTLIFLGGVTISTPSANEVSNLTEIAQVNKSSEEQQEEEIEDDEDC